MTVAGVTISPIAFLVIQPSGVKLMPINHASSLDKLLDYIPDLIEKTNNVMNRCMQNKKEETEKILKEMQNKHNKNMKKQEEDKEAIEKKIEEEVEKVEKVEKSKKPKQDEKENKEETYEFEYDKTMEDE